jgi:hypothetical protein
VREGIALAAIVRPGRRRALLQGTLPLLIRAVITAGRFLDRSALDQLLTRTKAAAQQ